MDNEELAEFRELTFSYRRQGSGIVLFTGTPDVVRLYPDKRMVAVLDYKFGRIPVQAPALNMQLRAYIAMVSQIYDADYYYGAIIQPRLSDQPHVVVYSRNEVAQARDEIESIWDAAHAFTARRIASVEACDHCIAKALCPEFRSWSMAIEKIRHLPVAQWTDEEMEIFELRRGMLEKFLKDTHEQIKEIKAADPERLPGWHLKPGNKIRQVTDIPTAWSVLQASMTPEQFSACCDLKLSEVERILWEQRKEKPGQRLTQKETTNLINELLKPILAWKQNRPSLVKDSK